MALQYSLPDLEERFLPPENWQSGEFDNPDTGHKIHYNFILPENKTPKGIIVALPGLSEFGEKYIETARFFLQHGYGFYVIDWAYQGRSIRHPHNTHKRHSDGYETDIDDLHFLIENIIGTEKPLYMLAHSMGGNIGLRYLVEHSNTFKAASFSAPMLGIEDLKFFSSPLKFVLQLIHHIHHLYIPGGKDWHEGARTSDGEDIFSSDPVRDQIHNAWCLSNPDLQVGNPTFKWIHESLKSIHILENKEILQKIEIPFFIACAKKEKLVDNSAIQKTAKALPNAKLLEIKNAKHEILMETDDVRDKFLKETLNLFTESI